MGLQRARSEARPAFARVKFARFKAGLLPTSPFGKGFTDIKNQVAENPRTVCIFTYK